MQAHAFTLEEQRMLACAYWQERRIGGQMTAGTCARYARVLSSFVRFARASGCGSFDDVGARVLSAFLQASLVSGVKPAASTSRFRLTVVRDAYAGLAKAGRTGTDPTVGLRIVQTEQVRNPGPLTPAEVARLRSAGRISPRDLLRPAAVELALAGGSHAEIAATVVADLDLHERRVRLGPRSASLDAFAEATLAARAAACRCTADRARRSWDPTNTSLALARPLGEYPAASIAPSISSSLSRAMASAGLQRSGIRPTSIREYAANRCYAIHGIEATAEFLGLDSLDVARAFIDRAWQGRFAEEVRSVGSE